jgi:DNA-binding response OmpR family regulator
MPYKDGYTLAKEIREKNSEVPIISLLQNRWKKMFKRIQKGADDYLNKPLIQKFYWWKSKAIIQRKSSDTKQNKFNMNSILENSNLNSKLRQRLTTKSLLNYLQREWIIENWFFMKMIWCQENSLTKYERWQLFYS